MAKVSWRGGALIAPLPPVMVSCGSGDTKNIVTVAWTGIVNTIPPKTYISLRKSRHSYGIIKESGEFVINLTPSSLVRAADYCGMYTGAKKDKFKECKLTPEESECVSCVSIAESPLSLECKVCSIKELGTHDMFEADIVGVRVDDSLLDENGKLCIDRARLAAYAHGEYFELGRKLGVFGFSAVKKAKHKKNAPQKNMSVYTGKHKSKVGKNTKKITQK